MPVKNGRVELFGPFAGRREDSDNGPWSTAKREFREETGLEIELAPSNPLVIVRARATRESYYLDEEHSLGLIFPCVIPETDKWAAPKDGEIQGFSVFTPSHVQYLLRDGGDFLWGGGFTKAVLQLYDEITLLTQDPLQIASELSRVLFFRRGTRSGYENLWSPYMKKHREERRKINP